jgi:predicted KAP-like P-loop ATPase
MAVEETMLAKLALFERCMGETATAALYTDIQASPVGTSSRIRALEAAAHDAEAFAKAIPPDSSGAEQVQFLQDWTVLEPPLSDTDLRPVSYLSRDTVALAGRRRGLSEAAAAALKALSDVQRLPSPAADRTAAGIPPAERADVLAGLMTAMRQHKDWSKKPAEANGAVVLVRLDASLREELWKFFLQGVTTRFV